MYNGLVCVFTLPVQGWGWLQGCLRVSRLIVHSRYGWSPTPQHTYRRTGPPPRRNKSARTAISISITHQCCVCMLSETSNTHSASPGEFLLVACRQVISTDKVKVEAPSLS